MYSIDNEKSLNIDMLVSTLLSIASLKKRLLTSHNTKAMDEINEEWHHKPSIQSGSAGMPRPPNDWLKHIRKSIIFISFVFSLSL